MASAASSCRPATRRRSRAPFAGSGEDAELRRRLGEAGRARLERRLLGPADGGPLDRYLRGGGRVTPARLPAEARRARGCSITVPDLRRGGGVAHFYERLEPYLPGDTRLFVIGKRPGEHGPLSAGARLAGDGVGLWRELGADDRERAHRQPQPGRRSRWSGTVWSSARRRRAAGAWSCSSAAGRTAPSGPSTVASGAPSPRRSSVRMPSSSLPAGSARRSAGGATAARSTRRRRWSPDDALGAADAGAVAAPGERDGPLNVLFLSRIRADKGVYEALEAVRLAQRRGLDLRVSVAGDGPDLPRAARWVNERGVAHVRFLGDVRGEEKRRLMAASDIYLFPTSHGEGMPATLLEAMAYGMGVVTCLRGRCGRTSSRTACTAS